MSRRRDSSSGGRETSQEIGANPRRRPFRVRIFLCFAAVFLSVFVVGGIDCLTNERASTPERTNALYHDAAERTRDILHVSSIGERNWHRGRLRINGHPRLVFSCTFDKRCHRVRGPITDESSSSNLTRHDKEKSERNSRFCDFRPIMSIQRMKRKKKGVPIFTYTFQQKGRKNSMATITEQTQEANGMGRKPHNSYLSRVDR